MEGVAVVGSSDCDVPEVSDVSVLTSVVSLPFPVLEPDVLPEGSSESHPQIPSRIDIVNTKAVHFSEDRFIKTPPLSSSYNQYIRKAGVITSIIFAHRLNFS